MVNDHLPYGSENWEQAQTLNLHCLHLSKIQQTHLRECSLVVIRDDQHHNDCSVFPPINHENLDISSLSRQCDDISVSSSSSSISSFSLSSSMSSDTGTWDPSSPLPSGSLVQNIGGFTGWMRIGLEIFRSKLLAMVNSYRNYGANKGAIWSIGQAVSAAVLTWWVYTRVWCWLKQRRRRPTRRENHLMAIIREKDEKIAQLLDRIVQMNEILISRHKALAAKLAE